MRKTKFKWAAFLLSAVLCLCTVSCSKDDEFGGNEEGTELPGGQGESDPSYDEEPDKDNGKGDEEGNDEVNRGPVSEKFEGNGTKSDPYIISTAADLRKLADDVANGKSYRDEYFLLTNDIVVNQDVLDENGELSSESGNFEQWIPIGTEDSPFCGTLDGNGYDISGIYINDEEKKSVGLFGYCAGTITHVDLKDSYIKGDFHVGGFVGEAIYKRSNNGESYKLNMSYCCNYATLEGDGVCGGCVAYSSEYGVKIDRCGNFGKIFMNNGTFGGGIAGYVYYSVITNCYNYGDLYGCGMGGIVGCNTGSVGYAYIYNCYNAGDIYDTANPGGISAVINKTRLSNCVNYGTVMDKEGKGSAIVFASIESSRVSNCYFLETSGKGKFGSSMTLKEIQSDEFTEMLNANTSSLNSTSTYLVSLGITYDRWYIGDNGFPVLASSEK